MSQEGNLNINSFKEFKIWNNAITSSNAIFLSTVNLMATQKSRIQENSQTAKIPQIKT